MPKSSRVKRRQKLFKNHVNDAKTALFIRYYFHLLDLELVWDVVQLTENPCFETWSTVVLGMLQELKARHRNESGPEHLVIITQQVQNVASQPWLLLAYLLLLSSFRKYLENEEVRWEWVVQCLQSVNNECLKCSCGAPRIPWILQVHFLKPLWWHLGFVPESPQEWKLAMELVSRHRTERVVVTCLSCGKPHKSMESHTPLTVQSVAQRMLASLGFEQAATILHELNLPRNSLGQGFYLASVLLTLIEQQQAALSHRMLSRLESYVWSRRPVTLPPQVADVLDREKQGLAGHDDLTDVQARYLSE
ncbi:hypothetical protein HPB50_018900 [Hyalomma asiaticum]|uniref:Uncharacterized protein n=1 Tax=Hyalomma asiaticum TaxID=266040 RepID=A0ACB7SP71_HYAAI|nr:hypothetical protein HPB50_018900 [Hyalomma asiaticum]